MVLSALWNCHVLKEEMRILCFFGFHEWDVTEINSMSLPGFASFSREVEPIYRVVCKRCKKVSDVRTCRHEWTAYAKYIKGERQPVIRKCRVCQKTK